MANSRKPLIPAGTVASPAPSLLDSIINRDRTRGGRARPEDSATSDGSNTTGNTVSNIASNTAQDGLATAEPPERTTSAERPADRRSAVIGSRPKIAMTTITVRIPTELNQWIADYVHERTADGITKQDVIVAALRMLRSHEEGA